MFSAIIPMAFALSMAAASQLFAIRPVPHSERRVLSLDSDPALPRWSTRSDEGQGPTLTTESTPIVSELYFNDQAVSGDRGGKFEFETYGFRGCDYGSIREISVSVSGAFGNTNDNVRCRGRTKVSYIEAKPLVGDDRHQRNVPYVDHSRFLRRLKGGRNLGIAVAHYVPQPDHDSRQDRTDSYPRNVGIDADRRADIADDTGKSVHVLISTLAGSIIGAGLMIAVLSRSRSIRVKAASAAGLAALTFWMLMVSNR